MTVVVGHDTIVEFEMWKMRKKGVSINLIIIIALCIIGASGIGIGIWTVKARIYGLLHQSFLNFFRWIYNKTDNDIAVGGIGIIIAGVVVWFVARILGLIAVFAPIIVVVGVIMFIVGLFSKRDD